MTWLNYCCHYSSIWILWSNYVGNASNDAGRMPDCPNTWGHYSIQLTFENNMNIRDLFQKKQLCNTSFNMRTFSEILQRRLIQDEKRREIHNEIRIIFFSKAIWKTVMILSFRTGRVGKQCTPRSDCSEQSDQGLHCLPFRLHVLDALLYVKTSMFKF